MLQRFNVAITEPGCCWLWSVTPWCWPWTPAGNGNVDMSLERISSVYITTVDTHVNISSVTSSNYRVAKPFPMKIIDFEFCAKKYCIFDSMSWPPFEPAILWWSNTVSRSISLGHVFITLHVMLVRVDRQLGFTVQCTLLVCVSSFRVSRENLSPRCAQVPGWLLLYERAYVTFWLPSVPVERSLICGGEDPQIAACSWEMV